MATLFLEQAATTAFLRFSESVMGKQSLETAMSPSLTSGMLIIKTPIKMIEEHP
jgi:hypothetical protein